MKKHITLLSAVLISATAYSQVGINTETPKATLDIAINTTTTTPLPEGIIAPRMSGDDIQGKDALYDTDQKGAIVYSTSAVTTSTTKTANITAEGYYYFDGNIWQALRGAEPWKVSGSTTDATSNTQSIYQMGKVSIGQNPGSVPTANLQVFENNSSGDPGISYGINSTMYTNKQGVKYGINNFVYDTSTAGSGSLTGLYSAVQDASTVSRAGHGGLFNYNLAGAKNNGASTHVHGLSNNITLQAVGGDLTTGYSYANMATAYGYATSGNLTVGGALRAYSGYAIPSAAAGYTFTANGDDVMGGHFTSRPTPSGGVVNIARTVGVSSQFEPRGTGTINITGYAAALRSLTSFSDTSTKSVNRLYGLLVEKTESGGTRAISASYGIYIQPYRFTGDTATNAYNLYSEGTNTKNYFQGKVGIGSTTPSAQLHVVKQSSDLTPAIIVGCDEYADNIAAVAAGLPTGALYRTGDILKVVH
ncbi:hypothetical protein [Epilithonimonas hungarica]|uniref:Head domain of trimeric autotransporter adhesin n=1 Tax=Epilithonimonas hungarica TaxID=454006 RepID=A0A1G7IB80_9FLAO|nr:hypothetical protein [Epilithonimonas hungarica]SDF09893.1 hypothetical protein SAMN05421825_1034 [Epilithonimonas hungarica]